MGCFFQQPNTITSGGRIRRLLENTKRFSSCEPLLRSLPCSAGTARAEDPTGQETLRSFTSHAEKELSFFKEAHFASEEAEAVPAT